MTIIQGRFTEEVGRPNLFSGENDMPTQILKSNALVVYVQGEHIQDVQILIDNRELYNRLPGKFERHGVKTLSSWPFFVTAILNEQSPVNDN